LLRRTASVKKIRELMVDVRKERGSFWIDVLCMRHGDDRGKSKRSVTDVLRIYALSMLLLLGLGILQDLALLFVTRLHSSKIRTS
jgi:hypothetical protein